VDVQAVINAVLGIGSADCDVNLDLKIDAADVQLVINAVLGIDISLQVPDMVHINEFAASLTDALGYFDEDGDNSDWIELYNPSDEAVDLLGWSMTDDADVPDKWIFPAVSIASGEYLVVFASGKDRKLSPGGQLHTNFSLRREGEYLALFDSLGALYSVNLLAPEYPEQRSDYTYGRYRGESSRRYLYPPTPGSPNEDATAYRDSIGGVAFSPERGFYEEGFELALSGQSPGTDVYYTLDGSVPSRTNGTFYTSAIPVSGIATVRAVAFKDGYIQSRVSTHTYLFLDDVAAQPELPTGFPELWHPGYPVNYQMHPGVIEEYAEEIDDAFKSIPTLSIVMDMDDLFSQETGIYPNSQSRGIEWERPASAELIFSDGTEGFDINCGIRAYGDGSAMPWVNLKHSFRLLFKGIYGPAKLNYPLFEDSPVSQFDTIILRGGSNRSWANREENHEREEAEYVRDIFARDTQMAMGHLSSRSIYVHLYLNGVYWGLYNPSERPDASFLSEYYGGDKEDWDAMNAGGVIDGDIDRTAWNGMMEIAEGGLDTQAAYEEIQEYLDVDSLITFMILNHFIGNEDWSSKNWYAGRLRDPGAGFRFFSWDAEIAIFDPWFNNTGHNAGDTPQRLFHRLRANPEFRLRFADHLHNHLFNGGALTSDSSIERYTQRSNSLYTAIIGESARWGDNKMETHGYQPYTRDGDWLDAVNWILDDFIPHRGAILLDQYRDIGLYPNVEAPVFYVNGVYQHGGFAAAEDILGIENPNGAGTLYYTIDGTDPNPTSDPPVIVDSVVLLAEEAPKTVLIPTALDPGSNAWRIDANFEDSHWIRGEGIVGYENDQGYEDFISIDVGDVMFGVNASCYVRIPFDVAAEDLAGKNSMTLKMWYDDGFVAYLNGVKIKEMKAPEDPQWNAIATGDTPDFYDLALFNVSQYITELRQGNNLLAIHGLNASVGDSSDFIIAAELVTEEIFVTEPDGVGIASGDHITEIPLAETVTVKARVLNGLEWSALSEATFSVGSLGDAQRVSEKL
jgi:hypothetical protein